MTAFIALSFNHRHELAPVIDTVTSTLASFDIESFAFVYEYTFKPQHAKQMMQTSFRHIRECNLLIAEVSHKGIGIGIEIGYATALGKPVYAFRHFTAEPSTTVEGTATHTLIYQDTTDLAQQLTRLLSDTK